MSMQECYLSCLYSSSEIGFSFHTRTIHKHTHKSTPPLPSSPTSTLVFYIGLPSVKLMLGLSTILTKTQAGRERKRQRVCFMQMVRDNIQLTGQCSVHMCESVMVDELTRFTLSRGQSEEKFQIEWWNASQWMTSKPVYKCNSLINKRVMIKNKIIISHLLLY